MSLLLSYKSKWNSWKNVKIFLNKFSKILIDFRILELKRKVIKDRS